jgi:streptogramin lyase
MKIHYFVGLAVVLSFTFAPGQATAQVGPEPGCTRTYTLNADFDEGILNNVNYDIPDQLQLSRDTTPLPFVAIACSARGTAVRIDVNTGAVLGEYLTAPDGMGRDPSRTTVDRLGNVWVSNRAESGLSGGESKGSITRIALIVGGTRCNADGTPNPTGQYLKPPFLYSTAVDRDGDGLIKTSRGLGDFLPWTNSGGADTHGGVSTADDECILNYTRIAGANARTVAVDANNDIWTGGLTDQDHEKVSGLTGLPIGGTRFSVGCGGYGGFVDGNGVLWSARGGANLLRYDTATPIPLGAGSVWSCLDTTRGDYGLGIDPVTGHIWHTKLAGTPGVGTIVELDAAGNVLNTYGHGNTYAQGVAVDGSGNVWVAHSFNPAGSTTTVGHLRTDGTYVGNVVLPGGDGPTGVAVDANGKIWVANLTTHNAQRIDPTASPIGGGGFPIGQVDLTVDLNAAGIGGPAGPYNYSDMTGFISVAVTALSGTWTVVHDGGAAGSAWGTVCWNSSTPQGTSVRVEVRAADAQADLTSQPFQEVAKCISFCDQNIVGQYLEVRTTLTRQAPENDTPILYDLSVQCCQEVVCPRTQGYWKNHVDAWPVETLKLGTVDYTKKELLAILKLSVGGRKADASISLAHQLIAAKLNLANGTLAGPIAATVADADALIGGRPIPMTPKITPNSPEGAMMTVLAGRLDRYNNGAGTDCAD